MKTILILTIVASFLGRANIQKQQQASDWELDLEYQEAEGYITDVIEKDGKTIVAIDHISYREVGGKYEVYNESVDVFYYQVMGQYDNFCDGADSLSFDDLLLEKTINPQVLYYFEAKEGIINELRLSNCK